MQGSRQERISDLVQREIARLIQFELQDSRLGFATVTGVTISADLRHAKVFVSLMAEDDKRAEAFDALVTARGFMRRRLGQNLRLKHVPDLTFVLDDSLRYGARIEDLLEQVRDEHPEETGDEEDT